MLWRIAWRNLWRHRARTLTMMSAVALAYALLLVGMAIDEDGHARMLAEAARAAGGDVLVHGDEYWATRASDIVIPDGAGTLAAVRGVEGVRAALPRIIVNGLAGTSTDTRPVLLYGVRPELEAELNDLAADVTEGTFLADGRASPIVLGSRLAERLDVEIGDRVVLTATGPDGEITRALFHLSGIHASGQRQLDELVAYTTIEAAQRALGMDDMLTQIGVLTADGYDSGGVAERIEAAVAEGGSVAPEGATPDIAAPDAAVRELGAPHRAARARAAPSLAAAEPAANALDSPHPDAPELGAPGLDAPGLEVLTWREAVPEMVGFIEIDNAFGVIIVVVLYAVVLFSITNTFLMAVMERVREFGLLNALGVRGRRIGRLLLAETMLMTALALGIGLVLALAGHLALDHWGISMAAYGVEEIEISGIDMADMVMRSRIVPANWAAGSAIVALATIASALYPAWRAARLAPAEAMRFYE